MKVKIQIQDAPDIRLPVRDLKWIDRFVGPEQRLKFVHDAVRHALLLEEHVKAYRDGLGSDNT